MQAHPTDPLRDERRTTDDVSGGPTSPAVPDVPDRLTLYAHLLLPRLIEEKMLRLIRQGRLSKWFSGYGQEAIAVGCALALRPDDYVLPMHRNLGVWTTRDVPLQPLCCQLMGREGGFTKGRDRTFHFGLLDRRIIGMISHLGAMLPVACGLALAARLDEADSVALAMIGEGATREGDFHEALNLAAVWRLPVVFVVENNQYGLSTPASEVLAVPDVASAASGYGIPGVVVDGNDVEAVIQAVGESAARARAGHGPTLLEMKTFRMRGHEEASGTKYVPAHLFEEWGQRDPVTRYAVQLRERGLMDEEAEMRIRTELERVVEQAAEYALAQPEVESDATRERADVFAPGPIPLVRPTSNVRNTTAAANSGSRRAPASSFEAGQETSSSPSAREVRFVDAISEALRLSMRSNPRVLLMGQDIAEYGGVFKVTAGFVEEFGRVRVRNTPIIESGVIGAALGLALAGYRPVVEMQYADFISVGFNQVVNNLATTYYRWGAPVNVTIRAPYGGYIGAGPFHSQAMEAWFAHVPGLKIAIPSNPDDARGLLLAAIEDPNPVLYFEHKNLYRSRKGMVHAEARPLPFGRARVVVEGTDCTIVTYGIGVVWAEEEAAYWADRQRHVEVLDLRTIIPWDREAVLSSVRKTHRVLVLHEAALTGGFGGEISSVIAQEAFEWLDAPPMRLGALDVPVPFGRKLEQDVYAARARLRTTMEQLLAY